MVTLITGASSGIGEEFARRYAAKKHDLVLVARRRDRLDSLAEELRDRDGVEVTVIPADLSEPDAAEHLWNETSRIGLRVDVLVNNAGFGTGKDVVDDDPERLEQEVRLNCLAVVGLTARYLPAMRERRGGAIINVSSAAAFQPMQGVRALIHRGALAGDQEGRHSCPGRVPGIHGHPLLRGLRRGHCRRQDAFHAPGPRYDDAGPEDEQAQHCRWTGERRRRTIHHPRPSQTRPPGGSGPGVSSLSIPLMPPVDGYGAVHPLVGTNPALAE